jgi:hypothetical protein
VGFISTGFGTKWDCIIRESFALWFRLDKTVWERREMLRTTLGDSGMGRSGTSAAFGWVLSFQIMEKLGLQIVSGRPSHVARVKTSGKFTKLRTKTGRSSVVESAGEVGGSNMEHMYELKRVGEELLALRLISAKFVPRWITGQNLSQRLSFLLALFGSSRFFSCFR